MGKQKRERRKPHIENPTGLPSIKYFENTENFTNVDREKAVQNVIQQVQSINIEEKLSGLWTLESMSCDPGLAAYTAGCSITKIVGPLLVDHSIPVRTAAACALRRIAENGGEEACTMILKDDIMTPLSCLLIKYYSDWQPKVRYNDKQNCDDEKETFIEAIALLWTLCENSEHAVEYSNRDDLISLLIKYLDISVYETEIVTIVGQCMLLLSEDNPIAAEILSRHEETLMGLMNTEIDDETDICEMIPLKILAAGLLLNIINFITNDALFIIGKATRVLSEALAVDSETFLRELTSLIPHDGKDFPASSKKKIRRVRKILGAQQQALEIFANVCTDDTESEKNSSLDGSEIEGPVSDYVCDEPMDDETSSKTISSLPVELVEIIGSTDLITKIWSKTRDLDENTRMVLMQNAEGHAILGQVRVLRCRAYLCTNNLMSSLEIDVLGGVDNVYKVWMEIGNTIFNDGASNDVELLESATSAMRATLQRLIQVRAHTFTHLTQEDIEPLINVERRCSNANVRANLIRILGGLASILISEGDLRDRELAKHISAFLLNSCATESEAWVMAEILDTIMDAYSEDESDKLAADVKLVDRLCTLVSIFKNKVRQQRKTLGDNAPLVSTVDGNICRFMKYKKKRIDELR